MLHHLRRLLNTRRRLAPAWWVSPALALVHGALDVLAWPRLWREKRRHAVLMQRVNRVTREVEAARNNRGEL